MFELLITQFCIARLLIVAALIFIATSIWRRVVEHREIKELGGYAFQVPTRLPFGVDFLYKAVLASIHHKNLEFWLYIFSFGNPEAPFTVETKTAGARFVFTADPENIKAILTTQFSDYGKGKPFHDDWKDFLGDSIFTTDGEQWHTNRQLIRPQFVRDRVSDLHIFEKHAQKLMNLMGGKGEEIDINVLFFRYTLDAATDFLFGSSIESLDCPQAEFARAFDEVQRVQSLISRSGPLNWFIPRRTFRTGIQTINSFLNPYIEQALRLSPEELENITKSDTGYTFLHAIASFTRDRKQLRDQLVACLLAGRDTTAGALSWLFHEFSTHPDIVAKLRHEILNHLGPTEPPAYTDLKNMRYLQHCLNEILRLYPGVPFNVRLALHDTTLPHGGGPTGLEPIGIRKDTPIGYSPIIMQRRLDLYPPTSASFPDPLLFCPDRWEHWQPKPWEYIPFNGGPRICVGQQFALTEMGYTVVRILQRFERVEKYWEGEQLIKTDIVVQPGKPVKVGFWEAKG
ncbi:hypothetical protein MMC12_005395 [Toensbergia leucococca]|nr:hypothetical protein [Toensbergia leucococca]